MPKLSDGTRFVLAMFLVWTIAVGLVVVLTVTAQGDAWCEGSDGQQFHQETRGLDDLHYGLAPDDYCASLRPGAHAYDYCKSENMTCLR